jgi:hypothetical protein
MMGRRRGIGSARWWFTLKMEAPASTETASNVSEMESGERKHLGDGILGHRGSLARLKLLRAVLHRYASGER